VTYLLDSNAWIVVFRGTSAAVADQIKARPVTDIALRSVVLAELWYGAMRSGPAHRAMNEALIEEVRSKYVSVPFDDAAALEYADIRAHLSGSGQPIGPNDLMIAAIARAHGLTLVTHNTAEFSRVPGLGIEDWQTP
jgi:tRNA(fMet)-specific endonuclease VapC